MRKKRKANLSHDEDWPKGLLEGWIGAYSFDEKTVDKLNKLNLPDELIHELEAKVAEFIWYRAKQEERLPPFGIRKELDQCEKKRSLCSSVSKDLIHIRKFSCMSSYTL